MTKTEFFRLCESSEKGPGVGPLKISVRLPYHDILKVSVFLYGCWADKSITSRELYCPVQQYPNWQKRDRKLEEARRKYQRWLDEYLSRAKQ